MYLNHRVLARIKQIFSQLSMSAMLLDTNGHVILPEQNKRAFNLPEGLVNNPTQAYVNGAFTLIGTEDTQPIFLCFEGSSDEVQSCARICVDLVNMVLKEDMRSVSQESSIRMILNSEVETTEIEAISKENEISMDGHRAVLFLHFTDIDSEAAVGVIKNLIEEEGNDYVCEVSRHAVALVKTIDKTCEESDLKQYAEALQNTLLIETGSTALIGIGDVKDNLLKLNESLTEAKLAINIGRTYHPKQELFVYNNMILERFLVNIPEATAVSFNKMLFNPKNARLFNDEMLSTIEKFFENNLNLSETARQLFIHRNTLVYRIDKIQKLTGLDLRMFDDALTFKLLLLMGKQNKDKRNKV